MQQTGTANKWNQRSEIESNARFFCRRFYYEVPTITKTYLFCHKTHESKIDPLFDISCNFFSKAFPNVLGMTKFAKL